MVSTERLFFELIQVALDNKPKLSKPPAEDEWRMLFAMAQKHAIAGIVFSALEQLVQHGQQPPKDLLFEWIGLSEQIKKRNRLVSQRCKDLEAMLSEDGFRCCVLKGQGTALHYKTPEYRQSGDIDMWVSKDGRYKKDEVRHEILKFARLHQVQIGNVDIKHSDMYFFEDVPVEVHFMPSWMFNPFNNRKLQRFFDEQTEKQFRNYDRQTGFTHTTVDFDLVFSLVHIYRHVFEEGIGLRQFLDYYHIVLHSNKKQRDEAYKVLKGLGMNDFTGGVMWVLKECFAMKEEYCLCGVNERHGSFLLSEIMIAGNFGHYDTRFKHQRKEKRVSNGFIQLRRNLHFLFYYPSEVLWSPFWKTWHYSWRKRKGYL